MSGLPPFRWSNLNKSQLLGERDRLERLLNGYRRTPPVPAGADRDRIEAKLGEVKAELATRREEWPHRD